MKINLINTSKTILKQIELPSQFREPIREDLIKKAVLVVQNNNRQPYGSMPDAGKRASAELSRRRRKYRGSYGHGISRVPRKIMSRRGTRMNWVGAFAPGTVGGRRAHHPKAAKKWSMKMNTTERRKAIRAALAATMNIQYISQRGHKIPKDYPFIIEDKIENLTKAKEVQQLLTKLGFKEELERISKKSIRAGKGKMRGRKYKIKTGPLFVVSDDCALIKAASNLQGVGIMQVQNINAELLAPGCVPGRLTLFTLSAVKRLQEERLFMRDYKKEKPAVKVVEEKTEKPAKPKTAKKESKQSKKPAKKPAKTVKKAKKPVKKVKK